jgi:hypothetical protein
MSSIPGGAIAVDSSGNVVVAGYLGTGATVNFGGGNITSLSTSDGYGDLVVVELDSAGN